MTVQTEFVSWQTHPKQPDPKKCAPICGSWWQYLNKTWGGQNLGCYVRRPIVGGTAISSHGSGAAHDWRYQNPGPGRQRMLNETMPFLINNSRELGLQAIHDYAGKRIWRPPGCSGRPSQPSPECGWQKNSGSQMNSANTWLHLEVLPARWGDTRTVEQMLAVAPPKPTPPPTPNVMPPAAAMEEPMALLTRYTDNSIWVVAENFSWKFMVDQATHDSLKNTGQYTVAAITPSILEQIPGKQ